MRSFGGLWQLVRTKIVLDALFEEPLPLPFPITEKSDVAIRVKGVLAAGNATGDFIGWMEAN